MKKTATFALALLAFSAVAALAAGPFYARGGYYDPSWSADAGNELLEGPAGVYTRVITSPMAAGDYQFKVAVSDWSSSWPNSNVPVFVAGPGEPISFSFDTNAHGDGWLPDANIVWCSKMATGLTFEVIGGAPETGSWGSGVAMTLVGDVWSVTLPIATPGTYEVKYRKTGDWGINIGSDGFGTNGNNMSYTTSTAGQPVTFEFNQATGRSRITPQAVVPTHATTFGGLKAQYR